MFQLRRQGENFFGVDGFNPDTSNYLRWLNCPRNKSEENVEACECMGKMFYKTNKDIAPGQELLVYYGDGYAETLGIEPFEHQCPSVH